MIVVGGTYREECASPRFAGLGGPGLRAAMALSGLSSPLELHTISAPDLEDDIRLTCHTLEIIPHLHRLRGTDAREPVRFRYVNALRPFDPDDCKSLRKANRFKVRGNCVLLLGLIEGQVIVDADNVVFEPEPESDRTMFAKGPSRAKQLALIMKARDFRARLKEQDPRDCALAILKAHGADVLLVRCELGGATIFEGEHPPKLVGPYVTSRWHRLGLGNVFAAIFAYYWAEQKIKAEDAARNACLAAAYFNEGSSLPIPLIAATAFQEAKHLHVALNITPPRPLVRLESTYRTYAERRLVEDAWVGLETLFMSVQTRFRLSDIDPSPVPTDAFAAMLLLLDFADNDVRSEATRAAAHHKPVIAYTEKPGEHASFLESLPGSETVNDFVTAIYRTAVASRRLSDGALR